MPPRHVCKRAHSGASQGQRGRPGCAPGPQSFSSSSLHSFSSREPIGASWPSSGPLLLCDTAATAGVG